MAESTEKKKYKPNEAQRRFNSTPLHPRPTPPPCPFCGGDKIQAVRDKNNTGRVVHYLQCVGCGNRTDDYDAFGFAYRAWARRPEDKTKNEQ